MENQYPSKCNNLTSTQGLKFCESVLAWEPFVTRIACDGHIHSFVVPETIQRKMDYFKSCLVLKKKTFSFLLFLQTFNIPY